MRLVTISGTLRAGLRFVRRNKLTSAVAITLLALGIGGNAAVCSLLYGVLLRPLPFPESGELVTLWATHADRPGQKEGISEQGLEDWRERTRGFEGIAGYRFRGLALREGDEPVEVLTAEVSPNLFDLLGTRPAVGRGFTAADGEPGRPAVVLLSHGLWQTRFGADRRLAGRPLRLGDELYTVAGILPPGFWFPRDDVGFWVPLRTAPGGPDAHTRNILAVARLKPGVSVEQARAEMTAVAAALERDSPDRYDGSSALVTPLHEQIVGEVRPLILVLLGATAMVLLICVVNLASVLVARTVARRRELSVRNALGAEPRQLALQLLGEALLLSAAGGLAAIAVAHGLLRGLIALSPIELPRLSESGLGLPVLVFAMTLALVTGLGVGLLVARQVRRTNLSSLLSAASPRLAAGDLARSPARRLLLTAEIALTLVLLIGAGLMIQTILRLQKTDPGWSADRVLAVQLYLSAVEYPEAEQRVDLVRRLLESLESHPEVIAAGATTALPGAAVGIDFDLPVILPGSQDADRTAALRGVTPGYFRTLGIPLLEGRDFESFDRDGVRAVIVNRTFQHRLFPEARGIVGEEVAIPFQGFNQYQIVGVVGDVRHDGLDHEPQPEFYLPFQEAALPSLGVAVRTAGDPVEFLETFRTRLWEIAPGQPLSVAGSMRSLMAEHQRHRRFVAILFAAFAAVALLLTATGVYGVMSFLVGQQIPSIGVRLALGAEPRDISKVVVGQAMAVTALGLAIGLVAAFLAGRWLASLLYHVSPTDPLVFVAATSAVAVVAYLGAYRPARRASRVDPLTALRIE